jgi:hypothetical protein
VYCVLVVGVKSVGRHERGTLGSGLEFSVRWFLRYPSRLLLQGPARLLGEVEGPGSCCKQRHTDVAIGKVAIREAQPTQEA